MSKVVIVATHNDQIAKKSKERDRINEAIDQLYMRKSEVYPEISAVEFVACHEGKRDFADIIKLANVLCYIATKIEGTSVNCLPTYRNKVLLLVHKADQKVVLMEQHVPRGFVELQEQYAAQWIRNSGSDKKNSARIVTWSKLK